MDAGTRDPELSSAPQRAVRSWWSCSGSGGSLSRSESPAVSHDRAGLKALGGRNRRSHALWVLEPGRSLGGARHHQVAIASGSTSQVRSPRTAEGALVGASDPAAQVEQAHLTSPLPSLPPVEPSTTTPKPVHVSATHYAASSPLSPCRKPNAMRSVFAVRTPLSSWSTSSRKESAWGACQCRIGSRSDPVQDPQSERLSHSGAETRPWCTTRSGCLPLRPNPISAPG